MVNRKEYRSVFFDSNSVLVNFYKKYEDDIRFILSDF